MSMQLYNVPVTLTDGRVGRFKANIEEGKETRWVRFRAESQLAAYAHLCNVVRKDDRRPIGKKYRIREFAVQGNA